MTKLLPIVKWAGGKRWLIRNYPEFFPSDLSRLVEPFVGGASVFLNLNPKEALLSDMNDELITTYRAIRDNWKEIEDGLQFHQNLHSNEHYYDVRKENPVDPISVAIRFLYLNRTCWNGLYRVNKKGIFNVPIGTKTKVLLPTDNFEELSKRLRRKVTLKAQDFRKTIGSVKVKDFLYIDPPYTVNHYNNGFLKYNESIFSWEDQLTLRDQVEYAASTGAKILISQANHESIRELYQDIGDSYIVTRSSVLAAKSEHRKKVEELLIVINYSLEN